MNKRTPEQWHTLFAAQKASGLSQAQFCKQHKLCPKYFSLRRRQLSSNEGQPKVIPAMIKVQRPVPQPLSSVSLHYQGIEVRFAHADPHFIAHLVKQLV